MLISSEDLSSKIGDTDIRIVDCRFELARPQAGHSDYLRQHIPGAVYADLDKDLAAPVAAGTGRHPLPDADVLARTFGRLGISRSTQVVVYDESSAALAARAWWLLRWLGHENVSVLEGGIARWRTLQLPLEAGDITVAPQFFESAPRPELVLETQEIVAAGKSCARLQLVDARDAARFAGEVEPLDPVAGHIPGAVNLHFSACLNSDGTWKDHDELQRILGAVLGEAENAPWSVMCGSGVTACHLIISALLAGLAEPRLYVGSWSEWITDSARGVATGSLEKP